MEHVLECGVVVVRVRSRGRVGEERQRVQELHVGLVEVMGLGLVTCGEGEDGSSVHTLLNGVVQVCHELLVDEEEEEEQGRQEEKEVKGEGQSEENTRTWMTMWMV